MGVEQQPGIGAVEREMRSLQLVPTILPAKSAVFAPHGNSALNASSSVRSSS